jgi:acetylglutamate kinase
MSELMAIIVPEAEMMNISNADRAHVLVEALPHIQKYAGKIMVVKYGGNAMTDPELKEAVMSDVVLLTQVGVRVVLVHGGGPEISALLEKTGKDSTFVNGLRVTDDETVDIVQMVLAGKTNKDLVKLLQQKGALGLGLCGIDGKMIMAQQMDPELGYVGEITHVNTDVILDSLSKGYIPVIASVAGDEEGNSWNVNADTAAWKIAAALKAESLINLTNTSGILRDVDDPDSLIKTLRISQAEQLIAAGVISGGSIPKAEACIEAVRQGVRKVFIIDGRVPHSMLIETLTDEGMGTMFLEG